MAAPASALAPAAAVAAPVELGNTPAYQDKLIALLEDRDPLQILAETPEVIGQIVRQHPPRLLRMRPFEAKWTPTEIIGHLVDAEWVYGYRIRLVLCENEPTIHAMDQELWVRGQRYNEREPAELSEAFTALRRINLALWRGMTPHDASRSARHNERGVETLGLMQKMHAGHDLSHVEQLRRYIAAAAAAAPPPA